VSPALRRLLLAVPALTLVGVAAGAAPVSAHPLGNFSVNHAHALSVSPERIVDDAVVDSAEIPTAQAAGTVDADGDGEASAAELDAHGVRRCEELRLALSLTVDGAPVEWATTRTSFREEPGEAGLATTRLECRFEAAVDLSVARTVLVRDRFEPGRVGWREITAVADGVSLPGSPVPVESSTGGLRSYPLDLLSSPLDVREVELRVVPGEVAAAPAPATGGERGGGRALSEGGPLAGVVERVDRAFDDLVGRRDLTVGVGLLAVALSMVLGASHALLPGHGKTIMAAYIAGRQGSARDAVVVGATVTATHTGGVLLLGLALTLSSALAGEEVIAWLGVVSGLLIAWIGASLLISSIRRRDGGGLHGHAHGHGHGHGHGHHHDHGHDHDHDHAHHRHGHRPTGEGGADDVVAPRRARGERIPRREAVVVRRATPADGRRLGTVGAATAVATAPVAATTATVAPATAAPALRRGSRRGDGRERTVVAGRGAHAAAAPAPVSRRGLIGMGVAGGLVPSPSALVVLLSAIALGRTAFGVVLVIGYGLGMAATLTAAGFLLVRVRDRLQARAPRAGSRARSAAARWQAVMPFATAALVLVVGLGVAIRSLDLLGG